MEAVRRIIRRWMWPYRHTRTRTVRFAFPAVVMMTAVVSIAALSASQETSIRIESPSGSVAAGERFSIDVYVDATEPINAVDIVVALPKENVDVLALDDGESVITIWTEDPYERNGKVYLSGGTFRKGFIGTHKIITIDLRATVPGQAKVLVEDGQLLAGDGTGAEVAVASLPQQSVVIREGAAGERTNVLEGEVTIRIVTDIDGDGEVTLSDISAFMTAWHNKTLVFDFSGDGRMTFRDFAIILADSFFK